MRNTLKTSEENIEKRIESSEAKINELQSQVDYLTNFVANQKNLNLRRDVLETEIEFNKLKHSAST